MGNKQAGTTCAGTQLQHVAVKESHQRPCPREVQYNLTALLLHLLQVELVALDQCVNAGAAAVGHHEPIDVVEH